MPKLTHEETIDQGLKIGVHKNGVWYARIYAYDPTTGKDPTQYKSTKIKYEDGRTANKNKARRIALQLAEDAKARINNSENPFKTYTAKEIANEWCNLVCKLAKENEERIAANKKPIHEIYGGKSGNYWRDHRIHFVVRINEILGGFWDSLRTKNIEKITQKDLNTFVDWVKKDYDFSPSYQTRIITQIRMIWRYAFEKDLVSFIPSPKRPAEDLKGSSRRDLQPEEYERMLNYAKERAEKEGTAISRRDKYLQFYCWLVILGSTGTRPPSSLKNAILWEQYQPPEKGEELGYLTRKEKNPKPYTTIVLPEGVKAFKTLQDLYKKRGISKTKYVFAHTTDREDSAGASGYTKGEAIITFKKQFETMLNRLGLSSPIGAPQKDRLSPYTLRGRFITYCMENFPQIRTEEIAEMTGTSVRMLEQTYFDHSTKRTAGRIAQILKGKK